MDLNNKIDDLIYKLNSKNFFEVIKDGNELINKYPNSFIFYNLVGLAYQNIKNFEESETFFLKAIQLDSKEVSPKNNLANTYLALNKLSDSEKLFKNIIDQHGRISVVLANFARLKRKLNDFDKAVELLEEVIDKEKNNLAYLEDLANCYQSQGNFEKSKKICIDILKKNPTNISAHLILSKQTDYGKDDINLEAMIEAEKKLGFEDINKNKICFAIGKAYEDKKNIDDSFKYIEKGNNLQAKKINYQIDKEELIFKNIKDLFLKVSPNLKKKFNKKKIIFICGLPRSGTTLVEQILSSHSTVNGAGELTYLKKSIDHLFIKEGMLNENLVNEAITSNENILNDMYHKFLDIHKFEKNIITDKAPQNFMWIGFIKFFFPNAKVIHCFRNPDDNFLSLYKNNFASNQHMGWSFSGENIVKFYNLYSDLMKFWKIKCKDFFYEINYDKLVIDKDAEIKKLLNYCELEWEENCLSHHKNKTPITTVSLVQARKPIYKSSLNSSKIYHKYLSKYFKLLNKYF